VLPPSSAREAGLGVPQLLAGPCFALFAIPFAIMLALSLAHAAATFFPLHPSLRSQPALASFWLIVSHFLIVFLYPLRMFLHIFFLKQLSHFLYSSFLVINLFA